VLKSEQHSTIPTFQYFLSGMWRFLEQIPYSTLIIVAVLMLLAPFRPMPHVVEKLLMLRDGTLHRPLDIFDLFFHLIPTLLLGLKLLKTYVLK
jgi:hypothetical protein